MKLIKLTNMAQHRVGDPIMVNPEYIIAIYEDEIEGGGLQSKIFMHPGLEYHVSESMYEVQKLIL